jgi:hypothetical protein
MVLLQVSVTAVYNRGQSLAACRAQPARCCPRHRRSDSHGRRLQQLCRSQPAEACKHYGRRLQQLCRSHPKACKPERHYCYRGCHPVATQRELDQWRVVTRPHPHCRRHNKLSFVRPPPQQQRQWQPRGRGRRPQPSRGVPRTPRQGAVAAAGTTSC